MRHKVAGYKTGRNTSHRRSLLRNLVTSVIVEERIRNHCSQGESRASDRREDDHARQARRSCARRLATALPDDRRGRGEVFDTVGPRFGDRNGGYTRIIRTGWIKATAPTTFLELLGSERCWTKSARSAPKPAPRRPPKPGRPWKMQRRKPARRRRGTGEGRS